MGLIQRLKLVLFTIVALLCAQMTYGQNNEPKPLHTITARGDHNYPPFEFINAQGEADGYNVDLINALAKTMGLTVKIELGPWDEVRKQLQQGNIDLLIGMYNTAERDKVVDFSIPTIINSYALFVRHDSPIHNLEDTRNKKIIVQKGDLAYDYVKEQRLTDSKSIIAKIEWTDVLVALSQGAGDVAIVSRLQGQRSIHELKLKNLKTVGPPILQRKYAMAVREGNSALLSQINEGLSILKTTGEYQRIHHKWFGVVNNDDQTMKKIITISLFFIAIILAVLVFGDYVARALKKKIQRQNQELKEANELFEMLAEQNKTYIWEVDNQGLFTSIGKGVTSVLEYRPEELIGKLHFYDLYPENVQEEKKKASFKIVSEKSSFNNLVNEVRTKSGQVRWESTNGFPILSESRELLGYRGSDTDITERVLAEKALAESDRRLRENETRLREIGNNLPNGMIYQVVQQKNGKRYFTHVSEGVKILHGYTPEEVLSDAKLLYQQVHPDDIQRVIDEENSSISALTVFDSEVRFVLKNGDIRWRRLISSPHWRDTDLVYDGIEIDITEKKLAEINLVITKKQAEAANRAKSNFLANMSHEIRTPMNAMLGMIEVMSEYPLQTEQKELMDTAKKSGELVVEIINNILDLSKIEAGTFDIIEAPFNLREELDALLRIFALKAQEKELFFTINLPEHLPAIFLGDAARIKQVLGNLLANAIKFTSQGGIIVTLTIEAEDSSDRYQLCFTVKDTGIGIEQKKLEQLFERFNQLDPSITRQFGGTGLGLNICKQIANLLGGSISVESTFGRGSCFHFNLPLTLSHQELLQKNNSEAIPLATFDGLRILVADDAEENRQLVHLYLRNTTAILDDAVNGEEACKKFYHNQYDVVLMDISMPILDGHSATRMIRVYEAENHLPPTPIIACTAFALINEKEQSFAAGCDFHLSKPLSKKIFLKVLADAVQRRISN